MGGTASKLSRATGTTSGRTLVAQTAEVREMSNALFQFMYAKWDEREVFDMAQKPGEYVIALSDLITNQFHVLGYVTKRNQLGEIYFMKYKDLQPPDKEGAKGIVEQRQNAMIIAFYFVRLFQILGALLLIVKDFSYPITDPTTGSTSNLGKPANRGVVRPMLQQGVVLPRFQRGGARYPKDKPLGPYEFLRFYLSEMTVEEATSLRTQTGYAFDRAKHYKITPNLFFEFELKGAAPRDVQVRGFPTQKFILLVKSGGSTQVRTLAQTVNLVEMVPYSIDKFIAPGDPTLTGNGSQQLARYPDRVKFDLIQGKSKANQVSVDRVMRDAGSKTFEDGAEYRFTEGEKVDVLLGLYDAQKDFRRILEALVLIALQTTDRSLQLAETKPPEERRVAVNRDTQMPASYLNPTINEVYQFLRNKTGQPHCIARALQLLDTAAIESKYPVSGKTNICRFSVGDKTGPVALTSYTPIKSLAQLYGRVNPTNFKDAQVILSAFVGREGTQSTTVPMGMKDLLGMGQRDEADELKKALDILQKAFAITTSAPAESFADLQISAPAECKGAVEQDVGSQATVLAMQSTAHRLMNFHVNSVIEISKFLRGVFNIKKNPTGEWRVEGPKTELLFAGFPALEQLTTQARGLLVDYYSGCESLYQGAVKTWRDAQPVPFRPAPGAPPV